MMVGRKHLAGRKMPAKPALGTFIFAADRHRLATRPKYLGHDPIYHRAALFKR